MMLLLAEVLERKVLERERKKAETKIGIEINMMVLQN